MMIWLYKPLKFYGLISIILFIAGILFNAPVFVEYFETDTLYKYVTGHPEKYKLVYKGKNQYLYEKL